MQSKPCQTLDPTSALLHAVLSDRTRVRSSNFRYHLHRGSIHMGERVGTVHVWNVWLPPCELLAHGYRDILAGNCLDLHVAVLWEL